MLRHLVTSSRDTLEAASSFGRRGVLARPGGLGTCGWDNVGRRTTRIPTRGRVTRVPTSDSESTSKSSPTVFGTTGRLGRPATDWWGTGTPWPPPALAWHGNSPAPSTVSRRGDLGTQVWARRLHRRQLAPDKEAALAHPGGRPPRTPNCQGRRVEGSHRRLGRWPASCRGSPKDPHDHSVDSPSRGRRPRTPELSWIQSAADLCPHKATSPPEGIPPRRD